MFARSTDPRSARIHWPRLSVRGFVARLVDADARYRQSLTLRQLDDRMLRDIGASRAGIGDEPRRTSVW